MARRGGAWWLGILGAALLAAGARADDEPRRPATYTPAALAALDRALHAGNLDRRDLTFRKDLTEGHACLDAVREMLHDPLRIAPAIDAFVADSAAADQGLHPPLGALLAAHDRLGDGVVPLAGPTQAPAFARLRALLAMARKRAPLLDTQAQVLEHLRTMVAKAGRPLRGPADAATKPEDDLFERALRRYLPQQMTWHDVFASPYGEEVEAALEAFAKKQGEAWLHEAGAALSVRDEVHRWLGAFEDPLVWLGRIAPAAFPTDKPLIEETPFGRIALGTPGDDVYTGDFAVLIDPGGDDRYVGCRLGAAYGSANRRLGFFADLGGNDVYACGETNVTLGAAVLGTAAFYDLGAGNDRYEAGHCSLGAAMGGVATFFDDGGSDTYVGRVFTQGAAGFGIGVFHDGAARPPPATTPDEGTPDPVDIGRFDNDRLTAWSCAQAFARCRGIAVCVNERGNDTYEAGGVYLHAPLFADRYQSYSQGFAIGERGIDYAGGIAVLIDRDGNDRYLGDIYNQGVGYWYAAGLLYDGGGNDLYEMTQYGQGSGIHLAVGGLVDAGGHDTYVMHSGLGQGGSHDYAASVLHDRGGNDHYMGMTSCNGCGLTNSVGLHIDRSGNDTYAGREGSLNHGRPARDFASVGLLLDLEGTDHYLGIMRDGGTWRHTDMGLGVDEAPPSEAPRKPADTPAADTPADAAAVPEICNYEGALTQEVFDELWALAIRWEVGENRRIVPLARKRLIAFGADVLPLLDGAMEQGASGLELRAYQQVLAGLAAGGAAEGVEAFLKRNLAHASARRRRVALWLVGELKTSACEAQVVTLLRGADAALARRAAGVLAQLGSRAGDAVLRAWLARPEDELRVMAALSTLLASGAGTFEDVRPLLDHPLVSVRTRLATLLARHAATYGAAVEAALRAGDVGVRARRTLLDALARTKSAPRPPTLEAARGLLDHADWGLRADAARFLQHALASAELDAETAATLRAALAHRLEKEQDPYARFWLEAR